MDDSTRQDYIQRWLDETLNCPKAKPCDKSVPRCYHQLPHQSGHANATEPPQDHQCTLYTTARQPNWPSADERTKTPDSRTQSRNPQASRSSVHVEGADRLGTQERMCLHLGSLPPPTGELDEHTFEAAEDRTLSEPGVSSHRSPFSGTNLLTGI